MRGSRDFPSINEYRKLVDKIVQKHNKKIQNIFHEEQKSLRPLPQRRTCDFTEMLVCVTSLSTINVKGMIYSVPSQTIGSKLKVHIYDDRLECFYETELIITLPRIRRTKNQHRHLINYKHLIKSLVKKPQAFRNCIYKDYFFPTVVFRQIWEKLDRELDERASCREYVKILYEASILGREKKVHNYLKECLDKGIIPSSKGVRELFVNNECKTPLVKITTTNISEYNLLLQ